METVVTYLGMAVIGYVIALLLRKQKLRLPWIGKFQSMVVVLIILGMGLRIGTNSEVMQNFASIGLESAILAILIEAAVITVSWVLRRVLKMDRRGMLAARQSTSAPASQERGAARVCISATTIAIIISITVGALAGHFVIGAFFPTVQASVSSLAAKFVMYGLYLLVISVGVDIGLDENVLKNFSKVGKQVLLFPLATAIVTMLVCALFSVVASYSLKESLAVSCTFCWYSLGPNIIMDAGFISLGAVAFFPTFFRVILSLFTIPTVAAKVGYMETICMPAAAAMDVCISTTTQATNKQTAMAAFVAGAVYTAAVPVVIPLIVGIL